MVAAPTPRAQATRPEPLLSSERLFILATAFAGVIALFYFVQLRVPVVTQFYLGWFIIILIFLTARRLPQYRLVLIIISATVSARYLYWRVTQTLNYGSTVGFIASALLVAAEMYAVAILVLGFFQTAERLERQPEPLPEEPDLWPTVDIYVPTYNEPIEVLIPTLMGCLSIDYPKKRVYLLDDGRREEMRSLAERLGVSYLTRADNRHAKAGNINAALAQTDGDFVAVFDADHVPTRAFLQLTMGFFLKNPKLALVQTPHHFFNPDPFERNLCIHGEVPGEQDLFYHQIQPCSDFWNATFFCGSCAVLRRSALLAAGGIAFDTVTEDCHTSLNLHGLGYESYYLNIPLAAGLAPERYAAHITQRIRWARGMVQILRLDNPVTKPGLTWSQRLCYLNSMLHFMFGVPRLIYMIAPALFLLFSINTIVATAFDVVAYAAPHIFVALVANSLISRSLRHSFWAEVYETSICYYTARATSLALINPTLGKFGVTTKGFGETKTYYDWVSARPVLLLLGLNLVALLAVPLNFAFKSGAESAIVMNATWSIYNLVILGACAFVALEQPETRSVWRNARRLPIRIIPDGAAEPFWIESKELAVDGMHAIVPQELSFPASGRMELHYEFGAPLSVPFAAKGARTVAQGKELDVEFGELNFEELCQLHRIIFSSASSWINGNFEDDRPLRSFLRVASTPWRALRALRAQRPARRQINGHSGVSEGPAQGHADEDTGGRYDGDTRIAPAQ